MIINMLFYDITILSLARLRIKQTFASKRRVRGNTPRQRESTNLAVEIPKEIRPGAGDFQKFVESRASSVVLVQGVLSYQKFQTRLGDCAVQPKGDEIERGLAVTRISGAAKRGGSDLDKRPCGQGATASSYLP